MKRRILSMLMAMTMLLGLLPAAVLADTSVELTAALDFTKDIVLSTDRLTWTDSDNDGTCDTLTVLDDLIIVRPYELHDCAIQLPPNATLVLNGTLTLRNAECGIQVDGDDGDLTIKGTGALNIEATSYGIYVGKDLTVEEGTINITSTDAHAIYAGDDIFVNGGAITVDSDNDHGIYVDDKLEMKDGSVVARSNCSNAIYVGDDFTVEGGAVEAESKANHGIYVKNDFIMNDGIVTATSTEKKAIFVSDNFNMNGGAVSATADDEVIYVEGDYKGEDGVVNLALADADATIALCADEISLDEDICVTGGAVDGGKIKATQSMVVLKKDSDDTTLLPAPTPTEPVPTEPATTEPATTEPATTEPATTEPAPTTSTVPSTSTVVTPSATTKNDDGGVTASVMTTTKASGAIVTATVTDKNVETAIAAAKEAEDGESRVSIPVSIRSGTDTVHAIVSVTAANAIVSSDVTSLAVDSGLGTVIVPRQALAEIASQATGNEIQITVQKLESERDLNEIQQAVVANGQVADLRVTSGGQPISSFGGHEVEVVLPYTLKMGEQAEEVEVWYIDDAGNVTQMDTVYDAVAGTATFKTTHFSVYAIMCGDSVFTDIDHTAFYYEALLWAMTNGVASGTNTSALYPNMVCTRAYATTFLWNAVGQPFVRYNNRFTDVSVNDWFYESVLWAKCLGVTAGTSTTTFDPDVVCTRAQIVTFLWRAAGLPKANRANPFVDVSEDSYYYDAVLWAVSQGITEGTSAQYFSPDKACSIAEILTFVYRNLAK